MRDNTYDVIIIGGGAAGLTAGIYTCRAGLKTLMLERLMPGGQVINAAHIENFPGFPDGISGAEIGPLMLQQAMKYGLDIRLGEVDELAQNGSYWQASAWGEDYFGQCDHCRRRFNSTEARSSRRGRTLWRGGVVLRDM